RIGGAARLDDHALEARDLAARAAAVEVGERLVERAGVRAAKAPGVEQHDVVGGLRDQDVVQADLAELVDDHRGVGEGGVLQSPVEQRRLAAAEETGEQKNRGHERRLWSPKSCTMASRSQRFAESFSTRGCQESETSKLGMEIGSGCTLIFTRRVQTSATWAGRLTIRSVPATMSGMTTKCGTRSATFCSTPCSASARSSCWWPDPI